MFRSFCPLLLLVLLSGCTHGPVHRRLAAIDSLTEQHYDSALLLLRQMDTLPMRRADRMYLELLRGKAMNKADSLFTTDSLMRRVVRYYDRHGTPNCRMLAHYVLGCAYRDMQSAPRALEQYQQAIDVADTTAADCDLNTLMRVHSQMADLFHRLHLYEEAHNQDSIAQRLAWQIGDTLSALRLEEQKCNYLSVAEKHEACIEKVLELQRKYNQYGFKAAANILDIFLIKSYLVLQEYEKAKGLITKLKCNPLIETDARSLKGGKGILHYYEGKYFLGVNNVDSAEISFRNGLPYVQLNNNALLLYKGLSDVYALQHKADSVLKYTTLYTDEKERRYNESMGRATLQLSAVYNYSVEQRHAARQQRKAYLWRMFAMALLAAASVVLLRLWQKKARIHHLNNALRQKVDQLVREEAKTTGDLAQKEDQILRLKGQVEFLCNELSLIKSGRRSATLSQSPIAERFRRSLVNPKEPPITDEDWKQLSDTVHHHCPSPTALLSATHGVSLAEQRLCMLLLCGFKPFEIDDLMGMKHSFASQTRQRLHKKVFGAEGTAADFDRKLRLLS